MFALDPFDATLILLHTRIAWHVPHFTRPPKGIRKYAELCAVMVRRYAVITGAKPRRPIANGDLVPFAMASPLVVLHHRSRGDFLSALTVAPGLLRSFFDVLVFALLFATHAPQVFASWHVLSLSSYARGWETRIVIKSRADRPHVQSASRFLGAFYA